MAAVKALSYGSDCLGSDCGLTTTTLPRAIGWDEGDIRIRLRFIAKAWEAWREDKDIFRSGWVCIQ